MRHLVGGALLVACLSARLAWAEEAGRGTFSLATTPRVMVYIDGRRVGMSPVINQSLTAGEHRVSLLLILPNGNRLRADYRVIVEAGRDTVATLDLARDAPREGELRTIAPPRPLQPRPARPVTPPTPPAPQATGPAPTPPAPQATGPAATPAPPPAGLSWATSPGRPRTGPVAVTSRPPEPRRPPPPPPPPPPPEPERGLTRDMVRDGMEAMRPVVERCMRGTAGLIQVRLTIQPDGGITDVEVQGAYRGTSIGDCIEGALPDEAAFPIYSGDPFPVVYPYRVVER
jgi:hypothetical protein